MSEPDRIRWQCRRGLLELDILLARFLDAHLASLPPAQLATFKEMLRFSDNDLLDMALRKRPAPNPEMADIIKLFE